MPSFSVSAPVITSVRITSTNDGTPPTGWAIGNPSPIGVIPEPATWAMLILGVAMIGFTARRQREGMAAAA